MKQAARALGLAAPRLAHLSLRVADLEACERFYVDVLGLDVIWRPDPDHVHLSSGSDDLALERHDGAGGPETGGALDHLGFFLEREGDVDAWHARLREAGVEVPGPPRTHRDGARSLYCLDPAGHTVQLLWRPRGSEG